MEHQDVATVFATLALLAGAGAVVLAFGLLVGPRVPALDRLTWWVRDHAFLLGAGVALVSTLGSLYFSEVAHWEPCRYCWIQRIAMYPIAVIALVALIRRDRGARWYVLPLAVIGLGISSYHVMIEWGWIADSESCLLFGPSCADVWFESFGFVTLALMAWAGFVSIIVLNTVSFDAVDPREAP